MARKSLPSKEKSHNGLSGDEFQRQLLNWFQDRGLLADLQAHLRHQMIVALKDTSLSIHSTGTFHQAGSPKLQAINLLVAEFLLRQQCHYTLSVFTSEVPLLRNLPEFSTAVSTSSRHAEHKSREEKFPGFHERDVFDILEALGFASNSEESQAINDLYEHSQGESLLTCLIHSLPNTNRTYGKIVSRSESPDPKSIAEQNAALQQCLLFSEDMCTVIRQSNLVPEHITLLHDAVKRILEDEVKTAQRKEEEKYHQELINREQRIQAVWNQHDEEMKENKRMSEEKLSRECLKLTKELHQKQAQFAVMAAQLREQQHEVASQLSYIQERSDILERKEVQLKVYKKESEESLHKKQEELDSKEKYIEEERVRLEAETKAREQERKELEANRIQIEAASRAIKDSQAEIALLRDLQRQQSSHLKFSQDNLTSSGEIGPQRRKSDTSTKKKKTTELSSQGVQADLIKQRGAVPKKHNVHQQTHQVPRENQSLQTQISGTDMDDVFLQLRQQSAENERRRSQHEMIGNLVDQLQQENMELRGHIEQQRLRIQELTAQSAELMHRLSSAHTTITRLRTEPVHSEHDHHGVQTSPRSSSDTQAAPPAIPVRDSVPGLALGAYGYHTPTPAPLPPRHVPEARPPARGFVRSSQVGAGEESYFSRRLPPETFVPLYASPNHREQRRKPPRRFMVHSVSSSDDSCPSPTEDMLREARRRLRRLEDETAAIDRSYQEFRLRNADNLTNTASILFQPLSLSGDYGTNFAMPAPPSIPARTMAPNPPVFPFPPAYSRSRLYAARVGLLNQFQSTTLLQPGVLQPFPFFPLPRTSEQPRQNYPFTSSQAQSSPAVNPLYSVPTEIFSARPPSSLGGSATTMSHGPPLSSVGVQNDIQNASVARGSVSDLRLPVGFNLREQSRYIGERESLQRMDQQNKSSRWLQEPPPCTSSVPHIPTPIQTNELQKKDPISPKESEKPLVFLHQESLNMRTQHITNEQPEGLRYSSAAIGLAMPTPLELVQEVSQQSATDHHVYEHQISSPQKSVVSTDDKNKSHSYNAKSQFVSHASDKAHCEIPKEISNPKLPESSSNSPCISGDLKTEEDFPVDMELSSQHEIQELVRAPRTDDPKHSPSDQSKQSNIIKSNENSCCQEKCPCKTNQSENEPSVVEPNSSHDASESLMGDGAEQVTNDVSKNLESSKESSQPLDAFRKLTVNVLQRTMERKVCSEENIDIVEMKATSENSSNKDSHINNKNKTISSGIPTKPLSNESKAQDPSLSNTVQQYPEANAAVFDDCFERHSHSPSLPSTLGSSKELSSDIISAGEEKSGDSW